MIIQGNGKVELKCSWDEGYNATIDNLVEAVGVFKEIVKQIKAAFDRVPPASKNPWNKRVVPCVNLKKPIKPENKCFTPPYVVLRKVIYPIYTVFLWRTRESNPEPTD